MKTKFILTTLVFAIASFILGRILWPDPAGAMQPSAGQLPFFIFLSALESIAFGVGMSFIMYGRGLIKDLFAGMGEVRDMAVVYVAIAWLLVSWWPHDNMHRVNGENMAGLLKIEYLFHFTLIISALALAYIHWKYIVTRRAIVR